MTRIVDLAGQPAEQPQVPVISLQYGTVPAPLRRHGAQRPSLEGWYVEGAVDSGDDLLDATSLTWPWTDGIEKGAIRTALDWAAGIVSRWTEFEVAPSGWQYVPTRGYRPTLLRRRHQLVVDTLESQHRLPATTRAEAEWMLSLLHSPDGVLAYRSPVPESGTWREATYIPVRKVERVRHLVTLEEIAQQ